MRITELFYLNLPCFHKLAKTERSVNPPAALMYAKEPLHANVTHENNPNKKLAIKPDYL